MLCRFMSELRMSTAAVAAAAIIEWQQYNNKIINKSQFNYHSNTRFLSSLMLMLTGKLGADYLYSFFGPFSRNGNTNKFANLVLWYTLIISSAFCSTLDPSFFSAYSRKPPFFFYSDLVYPRSIYSPPSSIFYFCSFRDNHEFITWGSLPAYGKS